MSGLRDVRVLVVENDEMNATLLQLQLSSLGAQVIGIAATVKEALAMLDQHEPQVAFLDYWLAGNERSDPVAQSLRERGTPFVLATGMDPGQVPEVFRTSVMLTKPYLSADLTRALLKALELTPAQS
ncbi:response regulator [Stenotrophomonas sp. YIM B06876]|uniref:response regulator n=1 Tax=Stenotrophomonas sp. YIM B06876 TaxID=3060211 RepID=UPI0027389FD5|nr:response regulator [Stenotrophomonas sp. YIM B06876]